MSADEVIPAAQMLAREGLVDAFGHVSARTGTALALTPPQPLGWLRAGDALVDVPLDAAELPSGAPKEAWIHLEIYRRRPEVGGICRAQPRAVNAAAGAGVAIRALHGQGAFVGATVPLHDDATLVRNRELGAAVAATLGDGDAIVLRGNGAVTVGSTPGIAAARMLVLEASAGVNLAAAAAGSAHALSDAEVAAWRSVDPEILGRLWTYLRSRTREEDDAR
ncbi:MAG: class II aldolase/adducin family protein [Actinomycetota bacterium]|nr:class II aldolase/adducin family protein [Actinomycetota bacterium]